MGARDSQTRPFFNNRALNTPRSTLLKRQEKKGKTTVFSARCEGRAWTFTARCGGHLATPHGSKA